MSAPRRSETWFYIRPHRGVRAVGRQIRIRFALLALGLVLAAPPIVLAPDARADDWRPRPAAFGVVVEIRGTGSSGGAFETLSSREQLDGKELVEWAAAQPWSTGAVGLHGGSYLGVNQLLTAVQQPKGLRAIFPIVAMADAFRTIGTGYQTPVNGVPLGMIPALGAIPPGYAADDPVQVLRNGTSRATAIPANVLRATAWPPPTVRYTELFLDGAPGSRSSWRTWRRTGRPASSPPAGTPSPSGRSTGRGRRRGAPRATVPPVHAGDGARGDTGRGVRVVGRDLPGHRHAPRQAHAAPRRAAVGHRPVHPAGVARRRPARQHPPAPPRTAARSALVIPVQP